VNVVATFAAARGSSAGRIGLVPTMGFLHEGHLSLLETLRPQCDTLLMSLFINPLQFGPSEDLSRYPRDLERDVALAESAGADVVFAPDLDEMYPEPPATSVSVADLAFRLDGERRPGHFKGVATVVAKLLAGLQPDIAAFGRKDAQQLAIIRRLVADLSFPTEVVGCPIVREIDGLALSSRNTYLNEEEREAAVSLSRGLMAAAGAVAGAERDSRALEAFALGAMASAGGVDAEYAELASQHDVSRLSALDRPAFLAVAARVGSTRLIDNVHFDWETTGVIADRGIRLTAPSVLYRQTEEA
jgi:pantoate--beta-alanine ligase